MFDSLRRALRDYAHEILRAFHLLSSRRKLLFVTFLALFVLSSTGLIWKVNELFSVEVPAYAGSLAEGIVGVPRFINPLLATSDADEDLTALVYSGLMRATGNGTYLPDLAEGYVASADNLTYTFTLREGLTWHDGKAVTASDVVFTIKKAQDPSLKSPKRANWEGVAVEATDDRHVTFTLKQPYALFLENATMGILPSHIWGELDTDAFTYSTKNAEPIGSGPYKLARTEKNDSGIPTVAHLESFRKFALGRPYIQGLDMHFYPNEEALMLARERGEVEMIATLTPATARSLEAKGIAVHTSEGPLPRTFGVFWNQNSARVFTDATVRKALEIAVDKNAFVKTVLDGYALPLDGPLPRGSFGYSETQAAETGIAAAKSVLEKGGWQFDETKKVYTKTTTVKSGGKQTKETTELSFSLSTSDAPELKASAEFLASAWQQVGARVALHIYEIGDLNQNVIRTRKYDALLFGEIIGRNPDLFAFWHSSQRQDPGLGIALYANSTTDSILEKAREESDPEKRRALLADFQEEIRKDSPALFLYAPSFIYSAPDRLKGMNLAALGTPSDRYTDSYEWYVETDRVWRWFAPDRTE
ncbi:MAG: peptide ABC transporter substrate-binding protein [Patescibacteria group bacterium]